MRTKTIPAQCLASSVCWRTSFPTLMQRRAMNFLKRYFSFAYFIVILPLFCTRSYENFFVRGVECVNIPPFNFHFIVLFIIRFQLHEMKDKKVFNALATLANVDSTFAQQNTAKTDLLQKVGKKGSQYDHILSIFHLTFCFMNSHPGFF
jgi:hypothetical protein